MLKRTIALIVLVALALTVTGAGLAPVKAAPTAAASTAPNASLLPPDTALYMDFHAADLTKITQFVTDTIQKVAGITIDNPYQKLDDGLTQALKRPASFAKDIQPWLGDDITVGLIVSDAQLSAANSGSSSTAMMGAFSNPNAMIILSVKDDTAAAAFLKDLLAAVPSSSTPTTQSATINGAPATIYSQPAGACTSNCYEVIQAKGFLAIGTTTALDEMTAMLKGSTPTLADDANFGKLMGTPKPGTELSIYISPRFYQAQLAGMQAMMSAMPSMSAVSPSSGTASDQSTPDASDVATPDTTSSSPSAAATPDASAMMNMMKSFYSVIQGQAVTFRMDGNLIALDVTSGIDQKALASVFQQFNLPSSLMNTMMTPIDEKLADQIPAKALAVAMFTNLPQLYDAAKSALSMIGQMASQFPSAKMGNLNQITRGMARFETLLKAGFDIDLQQDVFSWMGGEFATYMIYNPNSVLASAGKQPWPFDHTILFQVSDAAKATSFLNKLNVGLAKLNVTPDSAGDNLYKITGKGTRQISVAYGLVGNTFVVTTGSGLDTATAAIKGDGALSGTDEWKRAQANSVKPTGQYWYLNFAQVSSALKATIATMSSLPPRQAGQAKMLTNVLDLFESATISGGILQPDGTSSSSFQINLK